MARAIPSQLDDLNRDCVNDELCFLADFGKRESKSLSDSVVLRGSAVCLSCPYICRTGCAKQEQEVGQEQAGYFLRSIAFDKKTKDVYHFVHSHGVCFESDLVAMRVYFDNRQTIDLYGKINKGLVVEDTQFYPSEEQLAAGSRRRLSLGRQYLWFGCPARLGRHEIPVAYRCEISGAACYFRRSLCVPWWRSGGQPLGSLSSGLKPVNATIRYTIYAGHQDFDVEVFFR